MSRGQCYKCEFFHEGQCKRLENSLSSTTDLRCLIKMQTMMINNIGQLIYDYMYEEEED